VADVGYSPRQPINFSHRLHAGTLALQCNYCHIGVESGPHATIPATSTCMNCHKYVKTDSPEIKKIQASWDTKKPIVWTRVYSLPDYVYFDHSRHIAAGVACLSCHGDVPEMTVIRKVTPLSMGWCLGCHRDPVSAQHPATEGLAMAPLLPPSAPPIQRAPEHCTACHR
jgi:hypothetical protein